MQLKNKLRMSKPRILLILLFIGMSGFAGHSWWAVRSEPSKAAKPRTKDSAEIPFALPQSLRAAGFAVSQPIRDLSPQGLNLPGLNNRLRFKGKEFRESVRTRYDRVTDHDGQPINQNNQNPIRQIDSKIPSTKDRAFSRTGPIRAEPLPTPLLSFEGISFDDTALLNQGFLPPDTIGAVGPDHYVQAVNSAFQIWNKEGVPLTAPKSLGELFAELPGPCKASFDGDPFVLYDQLADRWMISQFCIRGTFPSRQLIAVSTTGDPTGTYFLYDFKMPNTKLNDYPKFGLWPNGYFMTVNQFEAGGILFAGTGFFAFDRKKILVGDPTASYVYIDSCPFGLQAQCRISGSLPTDLDGFNPPPANMPNTFVYFTADEYTDPGDALRLFDFHVDFGSPSNSMLLERTDSPISVAAFDPRVNAIPQPSSFSGLDPISDRLMNRLAYRRFAGGRESWVLNHAVKLEHSYLGLAGIRYYELTRTSPGNSIKVAEQQTYSPDDTHRWMGSIAMNHLGDTALGYSVSSFTVFPSIRYSARISTDPPGTGMAQGEQEIRTGSGSQRSSSRRWGDYSSMTVDPKDDCTFWYTQEYFQVERSGAHWQTRVASFSPRPCSVSPRGVISGRITACSTGLPLAGIPLAASGGYLRMTDNNGIYSMTVAPGEYDIGAEMLGYVSKSAKGLQIADGGEIVQDFCLTGTPVIRTVDHSVIGNNDFLEPDECNWLDIPLENIGVALAENVTATLSSTTPGVIIEGGTIEYGDILPGARKNAAVPFQLKTGSSLECLSEIDLVITIDFAGGQHVETFQKIVGESTSSNYVFTASSGADIPDTGTYIPGSSGFAKFHSTVYAPFDFSIYGEPIREGQVISVAQAGLVSFTDYIPPANSINEPLPQGWLEAPIAVMAPFWAGNDMRDDTVQGSGIFVETTGVAPNRVLMIEWRSKNEPHSNSGPIDTNFAVFFFENSDDFEYVYKKTGLGSWANGASATVGIQSDNYGEHYTQYSYKSPVIYPGLRLRATRPKGICAKGTGTCIALPAPPVTVSGRVVGGDGRSVRGADVALADDSGKILTVKTSSLGYYSFGNIPAGRTYSLYVSSKRWRFLPKMGVLIENDLLELDFVGVE
jgi:hypothetical protein